MSSEAVQASATNIAWSRDVDEIVGTHRYRRDVPRSSESTNPTAASCRRCSDTVDCPTGTAAAISLTVSGVDAAGQQGDHLDPGAVGQGLEPGRVGLGGLPIERLHIIHR